ncbi:MAG: class I SAM-dependent methyltransferase [Betaproteobacteria bacterium]|nr:class I SAM-dependent methyltransferase [Betaproteobacteria bacterium]
MNQIFIQAHVPTVTDELEYLITREIALSVRNKNLPRVLDLYCGDGHFAAQMAKQGAEVLAADNSSFREAALARKPARAANGTLAFIPLVHDEDFPPEGEMFDLVFCHHDIYRLPYTEARRILRRIIRQHLKIGGKLYISAYGLNSDLGEGYADLDQPIEKRFCPLSPVIAKSYNLKGSACLYTERNLVNLLFEAGGSVLRSFTTTHGTVKAVAVRV